MSLLSLLMNWMCLCWKDLFNGLLSTSCSSRLAPTPSDQFCSSCHTSVELSVHAWMQRRTMRQDTRSSHT